MIRVTAITGIDGSGKSTLIKRLHGEYAGNPAIKVFACPSYHHLPGSGVDELSLIFERVNQLGNEHQNYDLKLLGLYLQMTLYKPVLQRFGTSTGISMIVSERHALIDTVVYGALYVRIISGAIDRVIWQPILERELNRLHPEAFAKLQNWIGYLSESNRLNYDFWNYTALVKEVFAEPRETLLPRLFSLFSLSLPDHICFLKIPPQLAIERLKARNKQLELHESPDRLQTLQDQYLELLQAIGNTYPQTKISILEDVDYEQLRVCIQLP